MPRPPHLPTVTKELTQIPPPQKKKKKEKPPLIRKLTLSLSYNIYPETPPSLSLVTKCIQKHQQPCLSIVLNSGQVSGSPVHSIHLCDGCHPLETFPYSPTMAGKEQYWNKPAIWG